MVQYNIHLIFLSNKKTTFLFLWNFRTSLFTGFFLPSSFHPRKLDDGDVDVAQQKKRIKRRKRKT